MVSSLLDVGIKDLSKPCIHVYKGNRGQLIVSLYIAPYSTECIILARYYDKPYIYTYKATSCTSCINDVKTLKLKVARAIIPWSACFSDKEQFKNCKSRDGSAKIN